MGSSGSLGQGFRNRAYAEPGWGRFLGMLVIKPNSVKTLDKAEEARRLGADFVVNSRSDEEMAGLAGKFDLILNTVDVTLNWQAFVETLAPMGKLYTVGAVPEPFQVRPGSLIFGEKSLSGSALGTPVITREMLDFAARHNIEAITEEFEFKDINAAFAHLESGKARYRVVLKM